jgi:prepilin-type N-terminal cleavage/methylation domain-containing protein
MTAATRATRAGFTLVEVMIVIAIIAVLAALLTTAVSRSRQVARKVQAANDITQLDTLTTKFKQDFGFYPPSHVAVGGGAGAARFMVPTHTPGFLTGVAGAQNDASFGVLQRMFPRWQPLANNSGQIIGRQDDYPASNQYSGPLPLAGTLLDPNQAVVYFLGGPAALSPTVTAPKHNPANSTVVQVPSQPGFDTASPYAPPADSTTKKGPYFDFPASRVARPDPSQTTYQSGNALPNFLDPWGVPYAYFSASGDAYDPKVTFPLIASGANTDTTTDGLTASPRFTRPVRMGNKWVNPGKCQVVSAGPNRVFGPGSRVTQASPATYLDLRPGQTPGYGETDAGEDDIANFNEGSPLGTSTAP